MKKLLAIAWLLFFVGILLFLCIKYISACNKKPDLLSDDVGTIVDACIYYGDKKDTSAVRLLLRRSLDTRVQNNINYKGHSVNFCRLTALKKISGVDPGRAFTIHGADTAATFFYLNWAIKNGFVKSREDADIDYYR